MKIRFCVFFDRVDKKYSEYNSTDCIIEWKCPFLPRTGEFLFPQVFELIISEEMKKIYQSIKLRDFWGIQPEKMSGWGDNDISVFDAFTDGGDRWIIQEVEWCIDEEGLPMPYMSVIAP